MPRLRGNHPEQHKLVGTSGTRYVLCTGHHFEYVVRDVNEPIEAFCRFLFGFLIAEVKSDLYALLPFASSFTSIGNLLTALGMQRK